MSKTQQLLKDFEQMLNHICYVIGYDLIMDEDLFYFLEGYVSHNRYHQCRLEHTEDEKEQQRRKIKNIKSKLSSKYLSEIGKDKSNCLKKMEDEYLKKVNDYENIKNYEKQTVVVRCDE